MTVLCSCCGEPAQETWTGAPRERPLCAFCADPAHAHFGDSRIPVKLKAHRANGKLAGFHVYLSREQIARALGVKDADIPEILFTSRTVLDSGTGQVLLRIKRER